MSEKLPFWDDSGPKAVTPRETRNLEDRQIWNRALPTMADNGEVDFRGFFAALYRRKALLLLIIASVMGAALYWVSEVTPEYSAEVLLVIGHQSSNIVDLDETPEENIVDTARMKTETAILASRALAARVIQDQGLEQDPEFALQPEGSSLSAFLPEGAHAVLASLSLTRPIQAGNQDYQLEQAPVQFEGDPEAVAKASLLDRFLQHLTVDAEENSKLIRVSFRSTSPAKAASIANTLVDQYIENQLETKSEGARRIAQWLEVRLTELGEEVRLLEQQLQQQRVKSGSNAIDMVSKTLDQLNNELVSVQAVVVAKKAHYDQVEDVLNGDGRLEALPPIIASETVQSLRARHMELNATLSDLKTTYGDNHPTILSLRAEIADVERRRDGEIDNILQSMSNEVRRAELEEGELRDRLDRLSSEMVRLNEAEASIEQRRERLQASNNLYRTLLRQHAEAVALRDNQQPDARIISRAEIPLRPTHPNVPRVMVLAFVGSATLSAFALVLLERLRQKLDSAEDVERYVGLPVIGTVPDLPRLWRMKSSPSDYIQREPLSEFGSAFQRLRALMVLRNERKMPRCVLVTSSTAGEGKTTTAVCFAVACVTAGQKVLLIDCDFGRPRLHETVGVNNELGLTDVMKGVATLDEAIARAQGYSLSILTIGCSREGAIDLLNYGRMEELLAEIEGDFDTIILDSAPVLEVSNALILGGLAEKTLLVTRRAWTSRSKAMESAKQLELYGADIAGIVFNRVGPTKDKHPVPSPS